MKGEGGMGEAGVIGLGERVRKGMGVVKTGCGEMEGGARPRRNGVGT